jgi:alginate O-acetyltransferase complex protein AlgI
MIAWVVVAGLVLGQVVASRFVAGLPLAMGRVVVWGMVMGAVFLTDRMMQGDGAVARMTGICLVLLAGMKAVVYVEWSVGGRKRLTWGRHGIFGWLWFGMNPEVFRERREVAGGGRWMAEGLAMMLAGVVLGIFVRWAGWTSVWALFLPMSVGFHFGALRVLAGMWRCAGFGVKPLFRNPFGAVTPGDFWARRWNLGYSHMMAVAVGRPLGEWMGRRGGMLGVFVISGLLHELAITVPVGAGYGWPTLYFTLHGVLVLLPLNRLPELAGRLVTAVAVISPLPMLFPEPFQEQVLVPLLEILPIHQKP